MDHLPRPQQSRERSLNIPYFRTTRFAYDGLGFASFPERKGIQTKHLLKGDFGENTIIDAISLTQQWLFFGLLIEIFKLVNVSIDVNDFVCQDGSGKNRITTLYLPYYLGLWERRIEEAQTEYHDDVEPKLQDILLEGIHFINHIYSEQSRIDSQKTGQHLLVREIITTDPPWLSDGNCVLFSIALLLEAFISAKERFYGSTGNLNLSKPRLVKEFLLEAGWCRNEIYVIEQRANNSEAYYLSLIDRHHLKKDHTSCHVVDPNQRTQWNVGRCIANQIEAAVYTTRHFSEGCNCPFIDKDQFDGKDVVATLTRNQIPVCTVSQDKRNGNFVYTTVPSQLCGLRSRLIYYWELAKWYLNTTFSLIFRKEFREGPRPQDCVPYVAISHVWSDGLGNPKRNALPQCQLLYLQQLSNSMYCQEKHPVPFWIDTICVPLENDARQVAIRMMNQTYKDADKVVVLDSSLRNVSLYCAPEELLLRIKYSNWAQRLWTLPEGALAKMLLFLFKDGHITAEEIIKWYEIIHDEEGWSTVPTDESLINPENIIKRNKIAFSDKDDVTQLPTQELQQPSAGLISQWGALISRPRNAAFEPDSLHSSYPHKTCLARYFSQSRQLRMVPCHSLFETAFKAFQVLQKPPNVQDLRQGKIANLIESVRWRSTSRPEDETLCLGALLGIDLNPILNAQPLHRMHTMLSDIHLFPAGLLFGNRNRLMEKGLRWMPTSFLDRGWEVAGTDDFIGRQSSDGFTVDLPGLFIFSYPESSNKQEDLVYVKVETDDGGVSLLQLLLQDDRGFQWKDFRDRQFGVVCARTVWQNQPDHSFNACSGMLVSINAERGDLRIATIECNMSVGGIDQEDLDDSIWGTGRAVALQKWCLE